MSEREKLVEVMRAGAVAAGKGEPSWADCVTDDEWEAALAALEAAGVRLVPVEATADMLNAAFDAADGHFRIDGDAGPWLTCDGHNAAFNAALAASPYAKDNGNG